MKTPATPGRAQLPAAIGFLSGPNETAVTPVSPQARPGADAASAFRVVSGAHCPAASPSPFICAAWMVPSCSSARIRPDGPTAMAPGVSARPASSRPGVQFRPASVLVASGEKARFWLGRKPTVTEVVPAAATSPPLSATPCGVTRAQRLAPAGRTKSCQKSSCAAAGPPMTATAQVPCAVTSEVLSGGVSRRRPGAGHPGRLRPAGGDQAGAGQCQRDGSRPGQSADHERPSAWRAYWLSSTENEDLVLLVPGPGSADISSRM